MTYKKTIVLALISISIYISSCQKILFFALGIKSPKEETAKNLERFVEKFNLDSVDIWVPKDTSSFLRLSEQFGIHSGYLFFNENERLLAYKDTGKYCSAPVMNFAKNICAGNQKYFYKELYSSMILEKIRPLCKMKLNEEKYDYRAIIFWHKYLGERNFKDHVVDITRQLKASNCRVKIYLVNLDLQPGWGNLISIKTTQ